jgi:hypothetical protein
MGSRLLHSDSGGRLMSRVAVFEADHRGGFRSGKAPVGAIPPDTAKYQCDRQCFKARYHDLQRRRLTSLSSIPRVAKVSVLVRPVTLSP